MNLNHFDTVQTMPAGDTHVWMHVMAYGTGPLSAGSLMQRILCSGLYATASSIMVTIIGPERSLLKAWLGNYEKVQFIYESDCLDDYEWPALLGMSRHAHLCHESKFCYVHTKGASNDWRSDVDPRIRRNVAKWRDGLMDAVIGDWRYCSALLEGNDTVGPYAFPGTAPMGACYSGNFWWATGKHIASLYTDPAWLQNRNMAEGWVRQSGERHYCVRALPQQDLYDFDNACGEKGPLG